MERIFQRDFVIMRVLGPAIRRSFKRSTTRLRAAWELKQRLVCHVPLSSLPNNVYKVFRTSSPELLLNQ